jgi:hypothetical protein
VILDSGYWILDAGCAMQGFLCSYSVLESSCKGEKVMSISKILYQEFGLRKYYIKFRPDYYYSKVKNKT